MQARPIASRPLSRLVEEREVTLKRFLTTEREAIARAAFDMARAFHRGGKLLAFGTETAALDASRVAAAFRPPAIGRAGLPAQIFNGEATGAGPMSAPVDRHDIALGMTHATASPALNAFLAEARRHGWVTVALRGIGPRAQIADHEFSVPSDNPFVVQEVQETTCDLLRELVQIFMEDSSRLGDQCTRCGDTAFSARVLALANSVATIDRDGFIEEISVAQVEPEVTVGDVLLCHAGAALATRRGQPAAGGARLGMRTELSNFLYSEVNDLDAELAAICVSTVSKCPEVSSLVRTIDLAEIERCADAMRDRLQRGGRLITLGAGGCSADAQDAAAHFIARDWPAVAVVTDLATVRRGDPNSMLVKDSFVDQLRLLARSDDVVLAISTSRSVSDILAGLRETHRLRTLTCAITHDRGGLAAGLDWIDHRFVVSGHIFSPQATQTAICHLLLELIGGNENGRQQGKYRPESS